MTIEDTMNATPTTTTNYVINTTVINRKKDATELLFKTYTHAKWGSVCCARPRGTNHRPSEVWFSEEDVIRLVGMSPFFLNSVSEIRMADGSYESFIPGDVILELANRHQEAGTLDAWLRLDVLGDLLLNWEPDPADEPEQVHSSDIDETALILGLVRAFDLSKLWRTADAKYHYVEFIDDIGNFYPGVGGSVQFAFLLPHCDVTLDIPPDSYREFTLPNGLVVSAELFVDWTKGIQIPRNPAHWCGDAAELFRTAILVFIELGCTCYPSGT
jgi:hypothetical protein